MGFEWVYFTWTCYRDDIKVAKISLGFVKGYATISTDYRSVHILCGHSKHHYELSYLNLSGFAPYCDIFVYLVTKSKYKGEETCKKKKKDRI